MRNNNGHILRVSVIIAFFIVLLSLHFAAVFQQNLITDEYETIITAKFISEGKLIFKDFFQHHGPMPYLFYSPFFLFIHDLIWVVYTMRLFSFVVFMLILLFLYRLAGLIARNAHQTVFSLIAVFILLNDIIWWRYGTQIRPDNIMVLFFLLSLSFIYEHHEDRGLVWLVLAGLFASAAMFSKQASAIFIGLFLCFYFKGNIKKYLFFCLGADPIIGAYVVYFLLHHSLGDFLDYFIRFNFLQSQSAVFNMKERMWFVFSSIVPIHIKSVYVIAFVGFIVFSVYFYNNAKKIGGRYFTALFFSSVLGLAITFLWKTPYPQYYMPIQIMLIITGIYYLLYLKVYKKVFRLICAVIIIAMPLMSVQYLRVCINKDFTLAKQLAAIKDIPEGLPSGLRAVGGMPFLLVFDPAGFYWYYPPIFSDLDMNFLLGNLDKADIVFYDFNLYLLAPKQVKEKIFSEWFFVGRYYFPFSNQGGYQPISIFVKDKKVGQAIKDNIKDVGIKMAGPAIALIDRPIYIPVYFKATLKIGDRELVLPNSRFQYTSDKNEKISLEVIVNTEYAYFDDITNFLFPNRMAIKYLFGDKSVLFVVFYKEQVFVNEIAGLGLREVIDNQPVYSGIITLKYNKKPQKVDIQNITGGYIAKIDFLADHLDVRIGSDEAMVTNTKLNRE